MAELERRILHIKLTKEQWDLFDKYQNVMTQMAYADKKTKPSKDQLAGAIISYFLLVYAKHIDKEFYGRIIHAARKGLFRLIRDPVGGAPLRAALAAAEDGLARATETTPLPDGSGAGAGASDSPEIEAARAWAFRRAPWK